jgi:Rrf2 family transcriptional regulator, nitric oxide-sensitive transcriptional repressor
MRVTHYTDYSLRVLIYLGLRPDERSTIREISEAYGISRNHLMKVVQQLAANDYVRSARGVGGGLNLSHQPDEIRLGEVVRVMEPDLGLVECLRADNQCVITPACRLKGMFAEALEQFLSSLNQYSLADLLRADKTSSLKVLLRLEEPETLVQESRDQMSSKVG